METIYRDYAPKGVDFYYVYKALAHPELNGYITPFSLDERLMHIKEAKRTIGSEITWVCDTMANDVKHALGSAPNSEFIMDPEGKVAERRLWSRPEELRSDLERLVGPVENPTRVSDLDLRVEPPPKVASSGIVSRVQLPGRMRPIQFQPKPARQPFYAKLRAEVDQGLLRGSKGKLYLGFFLDPLYGVHWNNLVDPVKYEIKAPDGIVVSPTKGVGPRVKDASDIDPREFLLEVEKTTESDEPLQLTVRYYGCNDAEGWCVPVTQEYVIFLKPDPDGGSRMNPRGPGRGRRGSGSPMAMGGSGGGPGTQGGRGRRPDPEQMMQRLDANGDGKVTQEEVPEQMSRFLERMDQDGDGVVTREEISEAGPPPGGRQPIQ